MRAPFPRAHTAPAWPEARGPHRMASWLAEHSMQALRRQRKHSVMSCRLEARCSTRGGSPQASSTARAARFRMSRTLGKMVLGAVSLETTKRSQTRMKIPDRPTPRATQPVLASGGVSQLLVPHGLEGLPALSLHAGPWPHQHFTCLACNLALRQHRPVQFTDN